MQKNLRKYCEQKNTMRVIMKQEILNPDDPAQHQMIADLLSSDLSPENLCLDGELPAAQVRKRARLFNAAAKELKALAPEVELYQ